MSRHNGWAHTSYTQWPPNGFSTDAQAATDAPSSSTALPIAHKVWLLECKHCRTFLTNRGMKVRITR